MAFAGNTWLTYALYSVVVLVAFCGNALVLYVLITRPRHLKHPYSIFIFSLAVTDMITAIMLTFSRYLYFPPAPDSGDLLRGLYCRLVWAAWVLFTLGYISIYTCLALTVERWLAVVKPQVYRTIKASQAVKTVLLVWVWGIATNITTLFRVKFNEKKQKCSWTALRVGNKELPWLDITLQSIIPFVAMVLLYGHILYTLKKLPYGNGRNATMMRKVTNVALAASSAMIVGWLPGRISFMLSKYSIVDPSSLFHYCLIVLSFANSCVNPFLYGIFSSHFRKDYKEIFARLSSLLRSKSSWTTSQSNITCPPTENTQL